MEINLSQIVKLINACNVLWAAACSGDAQTRGRAEAQMRCACIDLEVQLSRYNITITNDQEQNNV